ncbi:MAG: sporulation protein YqfC [Bacillota bacterium]
MNSAIVLAGAISAVGRARTRLAPLVRAGPADAADRLAGKAGGAVHADDRDGMTGRMEERLADLFEIPKNVLLDMPRLVLVGNVQLVVENHQGILEYRQQVVRLATSRGEIAVEGKGLSIARITRAEVTIEGHIQRISLSG